jgi:hypothetical protein
MRSRAHELMRRALPLMSYCGREATDTRLDPATRAILATLGADLFALVDAAVAAIGPDDPGEAVVRDLDRARRRLRVVRDTGVHDAG